MNSQHQTIALPVLNQTNPLLALAYGESPEQQAQQAARNALRIATVTCTGTVLAAARSFGTYEAFGVADKEAKAAVVAHAKAQGNAKATEKSAVDKTYQSTVSRIRTCAEAMGWEAFCASGDTLSAMYARCKPSAVKAKAEASAPGAAKVGAAKAEAEGTTVELPAKVADALDELLAAIAGIPDEAAESIIRGAIRAAVKAQAKGVRTRKAG